MNLSFDMNISNFSEDLSEDYEPEWYTVMLLSMAYGTISILSVLGNILIIWAVVRNKRMHNVTNYFICNLALADIVIGLFATPFQFQAALLQRWIFPAIMCKIAPFAATLSVNISIITLVALSIDRYYVILHPFKAKLRFKSCFIIVIFIWLFSFAFSSLHLYNFQINEFDTHIRCLPSQNPVYFEYHSIVLVFIQYVIPFIIISFTYTHIGIHIYFDDSPSSVTRNQEKNKKKVIKMMFIVVTLFMICWAPIQLYNLLNVFVPSINEYPNIHIVWFFSHWFAMSNSCYNVFIYGACSARYKHEFKSIFSCCPCVNKDILELDSKLPKMNSLRYETAYRVVTYEAQLRKNSYVRRNLLKKKQSDTFELNLEVESATVVLKNRFTKLSQFA